MEGTATCFKLSLMKHVFSLLFISLFFVACQKETNPLEQPVAEQSIADASYGSDPANKMDIFLPAGKFLAPTSLAQGRWGN